jgi:hypothetical protein
MDMTTLGVLRRRAGKPGCEPFGRGLRQASARKPNVVVSAFGLAALFVFLALYVMRRETYFAVIDWWSFGPFRYPFLDLIYIPAQIECWSRGIDVYVQNPCDPLGRLQDYSPLWLRLSFLTSAKPFINVLGFSLDGLFMLSLAALPRPRDRIDYLPILIGVISPTTVFALERGNIDTLMFLFAMAAVVCMDRTLPIRLLGYGAIMLAGLLKFYPFVLVMLLSRERPKVFLVLAATVICSIGGFTWFYLDEMARTVANIPHPSPFADAFGAVQLPVGLSGLLWFAVRHAGFAGTLVEELSKSMVPVFAVCVPLIPTAYFTARHLSRRADLRAALQELTQREALSLIAGALLVCGCFIAGDSLEYRGIMILMVLPGLTALARSASTTALARIFLITTFIAAFLMISLVPQRLISGWSGPISANGVSLLAVGFWLFREVCWWWLVVVLGAILARFAIQSRMWSATRELTRGWRLTAFTRDFYPKKRSNHASNSAGDSSAM